MKARYLGNPSPEDDGPRRVSFAGKSFPRGVFVDLVDVPEKLVAKLRTNPYFEVSDEALTAEDAATQEAANGASDEAVAAAGETAPADKAGVIAALEALQARHPDVTFNPKAGLDKLKAVLEAAQFEHGDD